jgi:aspartate carbamoyltransferase catalytic subunit
VILEQVTNGIAVRMAVLYLCSGGQPESVVAPGDEGANSKFQVTRPK